MMDIDDAVEFYETTQTMKNRMLKSETERLKLEKEFIRLNNVDDIM